MDFEARLALANGRLKSAAIGVVIERSGKTGLRLRATLPPKPGEEGKPYQQRITLTYRANPEGLKKAEAEARKVSGLVAAGDFDWTPYVKNYVQADSIGDWVERFEQDYFTRRERNPQSETTWRKDYAQVFNSLPASEALTAQVLLTAIASTSPDTRTRKRFVTVCTSLAKFAGLEANFMGMRGSYSPTRVNPRSLPDDVQIATWRDKIPNPAWRRVYGLLAVYGLRPHEVFKCALALPLLEISSDTKTGKRRVYPFYPEWAEAWDLGGDLPVVTGKNNSDLGNRVSHAFARYGIPFNPYDLRHAWAVRSMEFGLDISLAAAQMGHSVRVHAEIYHAWISEEVHQRAYQALMLRSDRPLAPKI